MAVMAIAGSRRCCDLRAAVLRIEVVEVARRRGGEAVAAHDLRQVGSTVFDAPQRPRLGPVNVPVSILAETEHGLLGDFVQRPLLRPGEAATGKRVETAPPEIDLAGIEPNGDAELLRHGRNVAGALVTKKATPKGRPESLVCYCSNRCIALNRYNGPGPGTTTRVQEKRYLPVTAYEEVTGVLADSVGDVVTFPDGRSMAALTAATSASVHPLSP